MSGLVHQSQLPIEATNIALLGSSAEIQSRLAAAHTESAWKGGGTKPGVQVWRIVDFEVEPWPEREYGKWFEGDSYLVLHTYKEAGSDKLLYDLHLWLGSLSTQDERGVAAYKTVELDDYLHGLPVQHRQLQSHESRSFLSLFPNAPIYLLGGAPSGFTHPTSPPPQPARLFHVRSSTAGALAVWEVPLDCASLNSGDAFVLDRGTEGDDGQGAWVWCGRESTGKERVKAGEIAGEIVARKGGVGKVEVLDEGSGSGKFYRALAGSPSSIQPSTVAPRTAPRAETPSAPSALYRLTVPAVSSNILFAPVPAARSSLQASDVFILDSPLSRAVWVWIGSQASADEKKAGIRRAEAFVGAKGEGRDEWEIVGVKEGRESSAFWRALEGSAA